MALCQRIVDLPKRISNDDFKRCICPPYKSRRRRGTTNGTGWAGTPRRLRRRNRAAARAAAHALRFPGGRTCRARRRTALRVGFAGDRGQRERGAAAGDVPAGAWAKASKSRPSVIVPLQNSRIAASAASTVPRSSASTSPSRSGGAWWSIALGGLRARLSARNLIIGSFGKRSRTLPGR